MKQKVYAKFKNSQDYVQIDAETLAAINRIQARFGAHPKSESATDQNKIIKENKEEAVVRSAA